MKENPIPVNFRKTLNELSGTREPQKEPVVFLRVFDLLEILRTVVNRRNQVFVDETLANFIKQGVLYTQWPCHSFSMNNGYCMII
jgi:hypothetical protein